MSFNLCDVVGRGIGPLKNYIVPLTLLISYLQSVDCKRCLYGETGLIKEFYCGAYEYCCGNLCCRARSIGFFQLWYFWLLIMLMLLLCSGGGFWARYRRNYGMEGSNFGYPTVIPARTDPGPYQTSNPTAATTMSPPSYMASNVVNPHTMPPQFAGAQANGLCVQLPPQHTQNSASAQVAYPPPTYLGPPPPSYAVATGQSIA